MPYGQLAWLNALDPVLTKRLFDRSQSYVVGGAFPGLQCTPIKSYTSHDAFAHGAPGTGPVAFDLESGNNYPAPLVEKQHPAMSMQAFASTASAQGRTMIAAPSRDLVDVPDADLGRATGEDINVAYLRCGIPAACAPAQTLLVQSQGAQSNTTTFASLISGAKSQQPPGQILWAELTTSAATSAQMVAAYDSVGSLGVAGWWVNIAAQSQAPVAAAFFKTVSP
jgi:hypothetical protein